MDFDEFVEKYSHADVGDLLLHAPREAAGIDLREAATQISARQTARQKLPLWAATRGVRFGSRLNMEQCSSEQTARYKSRLVARLQPQAMADLTGGMGVDCVMMARAVPTMHVTYVERDPALCALARRNFPLLGAGEPTVVCGEAEDALLRLGRQQLIYIDPARRDTHGQRTYALGDCTPRVPDLLPALRGLTDWLLLKLSPMLDVQEAMRQVGGAEEVHVVSVEGECKELLLLSRLAPTDSATPQPTPDATPIHCVNLTKRGDSDLTFTLAEERGAVCPLATTVGGYLYEPNASVLKGGALRTVGLRYGLRKLAPNSHLYTGTELVADFPGRKFRYLGEFDPRQTRRASVTVRNYPLSADRLRRQLRLSEGGSDTLLATTLADGRHVLLHCQAASDPLS